MNITFVLPTVDLSGGNRVISLHAQHLQARGHEVTIVSVPHGPVPWRQQLRSLAKGQGRVRRPRVSPSHLDGLALRHTVLDRARPVESKDLPDADVVIATWWETAEWVHRLPPEKGAHAYFIQHHEVFDYLPMDRVRATWNLPMHKIVIAQWLRDIARVDHGDTTADLVPNAVELAQFHAPVRDKQAQPTVGMLYAPMHWKGTDIAIDAIEMARKQLPELQVVALGRHAPTPEFRLPRGTRYAQSPAQDKIREVYAQCDAWLFASRSEGYGLPIAEAMACRTPVIGMPAGAAPELLAQGAGVLVPPENAQAMARAIVEVCTLPQGQWRSLSERAKARVASYTWSDAAVLFEASLRRAIDRRH
jgi:glycosyltransferase involved in cell wall biosynthesis